MLTRDQLLSKGAEMPTAEVAVPEFGDGATVRVRGLSSKQRFDWRMSAVKAGEGEPAPDPTAYLVVLGAIDADGARIFPNIQDVDNVADMRGDIVERIADKVMELSGLTDAKAVEAKNDSGASLSGSSPTVSPATSDGPSPS